MSILRNNGLVFAYNRLISSDNNAFVRLNTPDYEISRSDKTCCREDFHRLVIALCLFEQLSC